VGFFILIRSQGTGQFRYIGSPYEVTGFKMTLKEPGLMSCRVCANLQIRIIDRIKSPNNDRVVPVCYCRNCGHFSLFPTRYQQQKAYEWDGVGYYLEGIERRRKVAGQVLERLARAYQRANGSMPESFLDAGCAIGLSLQVATDRGMRAIGIEPESRLAEYGCQTLGVDVRHGKLDELNFPGTGFDLIFCEQVLEHVHRPAEFLQQLKGLLTEGGQLYIGVPPVFPLNRLSTFMIRKMRIPLPAPAMTNIFHDPDEHISVFTRSSMRRLANDAGMHLDILPLTLSTLTPRRVIKRILTAGSSPGTYLMTSWHSG
jgi:SAM-dependent methyltransferase